MTAEGVSTGLAKAGEETVGELLNVVFDYLIPIVLVVVGVYISALIGLSGLIADLVDQVVPSTVSSQTIAIVADLAALSIWAAIAGVFWHLDGSHRGTKVGSSHIVGWVMRALCGLFAGLAVGELAAAIQGKVNQGQLANWVTAGKTALAPGR